MNSIKRFHKFYLSLHFNFPSLLRSFRIWSLWSEKLLKILEKFLKIDLYMFPFSIRPLLSIPYIIVSFFGLIRKYLISLSDFFEKFFGVGKIGGVWVIFFDQLKILIFNLLRRAIFSHFKHLIVIFNFWEFSGHFDQRVNHF